MTRQWDERSMNYKWSSSRDKRNFCFPEYSDQPTQPFTQWEPEALSLGGENSWTVKLTIDLQLMLQLRMSGAIPALDHMPSQQAQGQLYFTFYNKMQYPKQQITPAMEADALILILLRCVNIQKISVSNIIWHKCQSYFCSLLRVGHLKMHKYGTTFRSMCLY